ncbi:MAG: serine hydrolase [Candidatus Helarchaeota archaeon]
MLILKGTFKIILIISIIFCALIAIPIIISYSIIWAQNQNAQLLGSHIQRIFTAENVNDLNGIFDSSFTASVSLDYMLYIAHEITKYYGNFTQVSVSPRSNNGIHDYTLYLEFGQTSGTIGLKLWSNLINTFWIGPLSFYDSYLINLNWNSIYTEFANLPGNKSLLIARNNTIIHEYNTGEKLQVASTFKLFVLEALTNKINIEPNITWNTQIPILDEYKSLPSGILHEELNGTLFSLKELADFMINISDNTATDHLIHFINRTYVESYLPNDYPFPLLTTSESFKLRWLINDSELNSYLAMNQTEKLTYLEQNISQLNVFDIDLFAINYTHNINDRSKIEWTFNCTEIFKIQNITKSYNSTHMNPGLADPNRWKIVSFKGGSDIGVYSLAHAIQTNNGTWFFCTIIANNYNTFELDYGSYIASEWGYNALCQRILNKLALEVS